MKRLLGMAVITLFGQAALAQAELKAADVPPAAVGAPAEVKPPEFPKKLATGSEGFFNPGLLAQMWVGLDWPANGNAATTFKLRRIELSAKGEVLPGRVSYLVMLDVARVLEAVSVTIPVSNGTPADPSAPETVTTKQPPAALSMLQDAYMSYLTEYADVSIGQFKIPISYDAYVLSAAKLLMPDRSTVARYFGDKRDIGVRASKTFKNFGYTLGLFNGAGQNSIDTNNAKDLALRLEAYPVKGLTFAGVAYSSIGHRELAGTKDRWEFDARYERGPLQVLGELYVGRDVGTGGALSHTLGVTALAAYAVTESIVPAVRISRLDPNLDRELNLATDKLDQYWMAEVGCSYLLKSHEVKFQLWYGRTQNDHKAAVDQALLTAQFWY